MNAWKPIDEVTNPKSPSQIRRDNICSVCENDIVVHSSFEINPKMFTSES